MSCDHSLAVLWECLVEEYINHTLLFAVVIGVVWKAFHRAAREMLVSARVQVLSIQLWIFIHITQEISYQMKQKV